MKSCPECETKWTYKDRPIDCPVCGFRVWEQELHDEVEMLREKIHKANEHPLVMEEGGTDPIDRCHRVINKLSTPNYYWDDRYSEIAVKHIDSATDGDEVGDIVPLRPVHELPMIWVLVKKEGHSIFLTQRGAETAKEKEEQSL